MEKVILIIDDSVSCQKKAVHSLRAIATVHHCQNLAEARNYFKDHEAPNVILLDLFFQDGLGLKFFEELQTELNLSQVPVVFTTKSDDISNKVAAFSFGAFDYIVKPYSPLELRARIERIFKLKAESHFFIDDTLDLKLDLNKNQAYSENQNKSVKLDLTPHEFQLLFLFVKNKEKVFSREQILDEIWGSQVYVNHRAIDTHISTLRKKLIGIHLQIISVRNEGYKCVAPNAMPELKMAG